MGKEVVGQFSIGSSSVQESKTSIIRESVASSKPFTRYRFILYAWNCSFEQDISWLSSLGTWRKWQVLYKIVISYLSFWSFGFFDILVYGFSSFCCILVASLFLLFLLFLQTNFKYHIIFFNRIEIHISKIWTSTSHSFTF